MRTVGAPARTPFERQQQQQQEYKQLQQRNPTTQQQRVLPILWTQQRQHQQSSCLSEAAGACEAVSPCCCVCFYRAGVEVPFDPEAQQQKDEMYFYACAKSRQHPLKAAPYHTTNADAFLIDSQIVGVADGVGSVEMEGYDPALLPVELLTQCSTLFRLRQQNEALFDAESESLWASSGGHGLENFDVEFFPVHILARAHASCVSLGSTTCVLGMLDTKKRRLYTVNVGDSQLILLRRRASHSTPTFRQKKGGGLQRQGSPEAAAQHSGESSNSRFPLASVFPMLPPPHTSLPSDDGDHAGTTAADDAKSAATEPQVPAEEHQKAAEAADEELAFALKASPIDCRKKETAVREAAVQGDAPATSKTAAPTGVVQPAGAAAVALGGTEPIKSAITVHLGAITGSSSSSPAESLKSSPSGGVTNGAKASNATADDPKRSGFRHAEQDLQQQSTAGEKKTQFLSSSSERNGDDGVCHGDKEIASQQISESAADRRAMTRDKAQATESSASAGEQEREADGNYGEEGNGYHIIYCTEVQQHFFNCPYQLTRMPDVDCRQEAVLQRTQACADFGFCDVKGGDIVILGSDGLFDNVFEDDIVAVVNAFCAKRGGDAPAMPVADPARIADQLLNMALAAAAGGRVDAKTTTGPATYEDGSSPSTFCSSTPSTPFSQAAYKELGRHVEGGKPDDTTVVVAYVVDPEQQQQPCTKRTQEQHHARPWCARVGTGVTAEATRSKEDSHRGKMAAKMRATDDASTENGVRGAKSDTSSPLSIAIDGCPHPAATITQAIRSAIANASACDKPAAPLLSTTAANSADAPATVSATAASRYASRRGNTFGREELGSIVPDEVTQTSMAELRSALLTSSVAAHGHCQTSISPVSAGDRANNNFESASAPFQPIEDACGAPLDIVKKSRSTGGRPQTQKAHTTSENNTKQADRYGAVQTRTEKLGAAGQAEATLADTKRASVMHKEKYDFSHLLRRKPQQTANAFLDVRSPSHSVNTPSTEEATSPSSKEAQEQGRLHHSVPPGTQRGVPARHRTSASDKATRGTGAAPAETTVTCPATPRWSFFGPLHANPHNLTLVMRTAPTAACEPAAAQPPGCQIHAHSHLVFTDSRDSRAAQTASTHEETRGGGCIVDHACNYRQEAGAAPKTMSDERHPQHTGVSGSKTQTGVVTAVGRSATHAAAISAAEPLAGEPSKNTTCSATSSRPPATCHATSSAAPSAAVAVKDNIFREKGVAAALLASATVTFRQYAASWYSVCRQPLDGAANVIVQPVTSSRATDGAARDFSAGTRKNAAAAVVPTTAPATCAATSRPSATAAALPKTAVAVSPAPLNRQIPVSMSTVLACSRRSFPPVNAANIMSLQVHPLATRLQQMYAVDKTKALTPVAAAAAVGAGTSPACVAAVHMKILDRFGC